MQDLNLKAGVPVIESDIDLIWQQVDLLFDTYPGQLQGDLDYGTDYEHYLYELNVSSDDLKYRMMRDLASMDLRGYEPDIDVQLLKGTQRDIAVINVNLRKYGKSYMKSYRIE